MTARIAPKTMINIAQWLTGLGLDQYQQLFVEQAIDFGVLSALTDDDLKGLAIPLGHRKRLLNAIAELGEAGRANATLPTTKSAPVERRHVTVLFCDLVGSTQLSTELDPETLSVLLADYRRCCNGAITRWGGYVAKYMGDGVLAYSDGHKRTTTMPTLQCAPRSSWSVRSAVSPRLARARISRHAPASPRARS